MLTIVPQWVRLLFWPAHLQGEYGPPALSLADPSLGQQVLGAAILIAAVALFAWGWRRERTVALGCCGSRPRSSR